MSQYSKELNVALRAVHLASLLTKQHLLTYQSTTKRVDESTKADASEVTVADFAAQAVLISIIHHVFPDDGFIAEESSEMLRSDDALLSRVWELVLGASKLQEQSTGSWPDNDSAAALDVKLPTSQEEMLSVIDLGQQQDDHQPRAPPPSRTWILDPIDGTKTYIRGQQYAVCLSLVDSREQKIGVLGCPNLDLSQRSEPGRVTIDESLVDLRPDGGWIVSAIKGHGTQLSRTARPASRQKAGDVLGWPAESHAHAHAHAPKPQTQPALAFTDSSASPHTSKPLHTRVFAHFSAPAPLNIWSMQLKYVLLALRAAGADAMVRLPPQRDYHASVWDHAGGQLVLRESGGVLSDAQGRAFVVDGRMRTLEGNWGVVAVRGGRFAGGEGPEEVHGLVLGRVREEVGKSTGEGIGGD